MQHICHSRRIEIVIMASELQHKTFNGLVWTFLETFSLQLFGFVQGVILARLLMPSDYGLIAMTGIFFAVSYTMIDSGFTNALIRKKEHSAIDFSTVFVTNVVLSLVFALLLCACSSWIADFYNQPLLRDIVRVNALCMFLQSFIAVQGTRMSINLQFKQKSVISVASTISTGILSIIMAFMGYGVWSFVWPNFLGLLVKACLFRYYQHWFPGISFSWDKFREFFSYGSKLLASGLLNTIFKNIYPIIIGKCYSASELGHYGKAHSYAALPSTTVSNILAKVTFPVLAKVNDNTETLQGVYRRMIRVSAFVSFPIMVGMAVLARPFILLLITEKWAPAIPLLQVLCFSLMWYPIHALNLQLLMVRGRSDLFLKLEIAKKILILAVILIVWRYGVFWMCVGSVFTSYVCLFINTYYTGKLIDVGFAKQMRDVAPSLLNAFAMGLIVYIITLSISNLWAQMALGVAVGVLSYIGIARMMHSNDFNYCITLIRDNILHKNN